MDLLFEPLLHPVKGAQFFSDHLVHRINRKAKIYCNLAKRVNRDLMGQRAEVELLLVFDDATFANAFLDKAIVHDVPALFINLVRVLPNIDIEPVFEEHVVGSLIRINDLSTILNDLSPHPIDVGLIFVLEVAVRDYGEGLTIENVLFDDKIAPLLGLAVFIMHTPCWSELLLLYFLLTAKTNFEPIHGYQFDLDAFRGQRGLV